MIAVGDAIEFREIIDSRPIALVLAFCTRVYGPDLIDLGWKGDGNMHPDAAIDGMPVHRRTRVDRLGVILVGNYTSPELQPREHTVWEKR